MTEALECGFEDRPRSRIPEVVTTQGGERKEVVIPDGTPSVLEILATDPTAVIRCRHSVNGCPSWACVVVEVPKGCICFPDDKVQALCGQHHDGGDSFPILSLVDLTVGQQWTQHRGELARFRLEELTPGLIEQYKAELTQHIEASD